MSKYFRLHGKDQRSNQICKNLLVECKNMSPFSDLKMEVGKTTCREAAGTFYAALVSLKNRAMEAKQETPFGPIELTFNGNDLDDLDELANDVEEERN